MAPSQFAEDSGRLSSRRPVDRTTTIVALLAVVVALFEVAPDLGTPLELDLASMYALPLLLAAYTRRRSLLSSLSLLLGAAALVVYRLHARTVMPPMKEELFVNRVLDAVSLLVTQQAAFLPAALDTRPNAVNSWTCQPLRVQR